MESDRSHQVVARVVAWHNSHLLARRIRPEQVHSIGVVVLPFAVEGALPPPPPELEPEPAAATPPVLDEVMAEPPPQEVQTLTEVVITDQDDDGAASELAPEPDPGASPESTAPAEPEPQPEPDPVEATAVETDPGGEPPAPGWTSALAPARDPRLGGLPAWHPRRWWPGGPAPLQALFSEDFIAPLSPRRVARWVATHGAFKRPLGADAPERQVLLDAGLQAARDGALPVSVYVLTAAIGSDGRRVRLLLSPLAQGPILGARQLDRRRVGAAAAVLTLALAAAWSPRHWPLPALPEPVLMASAPAASAPEPAAASAPSSAEAPAVEGAAEAASSPDALPASAPTPEPAGAPASAHGPTVTAEGAPALAEAAASAPGRPVDVEPRLGRIDLPPIRPQLGPAQAVAEPRMTYALVMRPTRTRAESESLARRLRQQAGVAAGDSQAELLQAGDSWRAILFPFADAQRAERARQVLAGKGLAVEMVEF